MELDENATEWLALRFETVTSISELVQVSLEKAKEFEGVFYKSVLDNPNNTEYEKQFYKTIVTKFFRSNPGMQRALMDNFNQALPLFMSKVQADVALPSSDPPQQESSALFDKTYKILTQMQAKRREDLPMCPKCKTKEFMVEVGIQTRGGDEAACIYPMCNKCKKIVE